jgi:tRNA-specific 2-thiouridylase
MTVGKINHVKYEQMPESMEATVKIRYKDKGSAGIVHYDETGNVKVHFLHDAKGVAPGQSAVFYEGDDVLAGGTIHRYRSDLPA